MAKKAIRPIRIEGNIAYVPLTQGYEAVIDTTDVPLVEGVNWSACVQRKKDGSIRSVYGFRRDANVHAKPAVWLHRVIVGTPDGMETDHYDGDGLNNRRGNLRVATKSQNMHNRRIGSDNTSGVKGVSLHKRSQKWRARVMDGGITYDLGLFATINDARSAIAWKRAELHGKFARSA